MLTNNFTKKMTLSTKKVIFIIGPTAIGKTKLSIELAKTGDAEKRMLLVEYGLKVKNEAALGVIADLTNA